jgi:RNA polymerase sigma factor (TIGR02999 family)
MDSGVATLIAAVEAGDRTAREALFGALYGELHRLAQRELLRSGAHGALSPTTLLHEAYLDMSGRESTSFPDQARFMAYAARVMRGLIIDNARRRTTQKRGGRFEITGSITEVPETSVDPEQLAQISDALEALAEIEPELAEIVDLKFFCGFSFGEIADMRGVAERTVQRAWERARLYLYDSIRTQVVN